MFIKKLRNFVDSSLFQKFIMTVIILNSIMIGVETSDTVMNYIGNQLHFIDKIVILIFVVEIVLKVITYRLSFFKSAWNIFDLMIVLISVAPAAGAFSVLRALRIIRLLRLLNNVPKLRLIIESLIKSIPSIGWIAVLLCMVFYIFAVIGTNIFGDAYPKYYGTLGDSIFTLFQIMTLESWSSAIARPIMDGFPYASVYFVLFILIATYTTLNIFIAVVVNTMNDLSLEDLHNEEKNIKQFVRDENEKLAIKITKELKQELNKINKESQILSKSNQIKSQTIEN